MKKITLLLTLFLFCLLVAPAPRQAQAQASETLASDFRIAPQQMTGFTGEAGALRLSAPQGTLLSEVFEPGWEFMAVGVTWDEPLPDEVTPLLDVRVSAGDAQWGEWVPLTLGGEDRPDGVGNTFTELLFIEGRQLQLRATLENPTGRTFDWDGLKVTMIDGRPGPTAAELHARMTPSDGGPTVITRTEWGANESYRFDSYGNESWPREYWSLRAMFVHHTYSSPSEPDPAAAVRSIYYYHAITNGWGDIGYHYVIDQYGNVYQGRYGTEADGQVVEGAHALGYNNNTMGISLIGNFTYDEPDQVMLDTLESLLVARAQQYGISPLAPVWLDGEGDISPDRWFNYSILGHRDSHTPARTTCPGDALYGLLPEIRSDVGEQVSQPPIVLMASPRDGSVLDGLFTLQADATTNVVRVDYYLDESLIASSSAPPWSVVVDSGSLPAGNFTLKATGVHRVGQQQQRRARHHRCHAGQPPRARGEPRAARRAAPWQPKRAGREPAGVPAPRASPAPLRGAADPERHLRVEQRLADADGPVRRALHQRGNVERVAQPARWYSSGRRRGDVVLRAPAPYPAR